MLTLEIQKWHSQTNDFQCYIVVFLLYLIAFMHKFNSLPYPGNALHDLKDIHKLVFVYVNQKLRQKNSLYYMINPLS